MYLAEIAETVAAAGDLEQVLEDDAHGGIPRASQFALDMVRGSLPVCVQSTGAYAEPDSGGMLGPHLWIGLEAKTECSPDGEVSADTARQAGDHINYATSGFAVPGQDRAASDDAQPATPGQGAPDRRAWPALDVVSAWPGVH